MSVSKNYTVKSGVSLTADIETKVGKIADKYFGLTKKTIVVTSGTRSSDSQASAMYGKLTGGDRLNIYKDQKTVKLVLNSYDSGIKNKKSKAEIIADIRDNLDEQIKKDIYISKHLKSGAVDIRSRDMTDSDKTSFKKAAAGIAITVILETTPPHFHLQF